ncbi:MAG: hypothetical protein JJ899_13855, partial [Alphaproteobacteria bacterium]|nr:hypothetical protein [Alphaproteobacteria bacterium]
SEDGSADAKPEASEPEPAPEPKAEPAADPAPKIESAPATADTSAMAQVGVGTWVVGAIVAVIVIAALVS